LLLASLWTVVFFSGSSCKLPPYLLPAVPPICLVVGRALEGILSGKVETPFLIFVRRRSPQHLILFLLAAAAVCGGVDVQLLNGIAAGRLSHWLLLVGAGTAVAIVSQLGLLGRGLIPWATTGVMAVVSMGFAMQDFYPGVATMRSKVNPVVELCHAEIDRATPVVCFSLAHEADSLVFHLGTERVRSFDSDEVLKAVQALNQGPEVIVVANENSIEALRSQLPQTLKLAELGHYQHIFVGVCTIPADVAARR
jgi:dolichol-phosphate mannosyltransferase